MIIEFSRRSAARKRDGASLAVHQPGHPPEIQRSDPTLDMSSNNQHHLGQNSFAPQEMVTRVLVVKTRYRLYDKVGEIAPVIYNARIEDRPRGRGSLGSRCSWYARCRDRKCAKRLCKMLRKHGTQVREPILNTHLAAAKLRGHVVRRG